MYVCKLVNYGSLVGLERGGLVRSLSGLSVFSIIWSVIVKVSFVPALFTDIFIFCFGNANVFEGIDFSRVFCHQCSFVSFWFY